MKRSLSLLLAAVFMLAGCDSDSDDTAGLMLSFTGLEPLTNGFHYEGWAIMNSPVSTGKFNVATNGGLVDLSGRAISGGRFNPDVDLTSASAIVITIEPSGDSDAVPSATKILGGAVAGGLASLRVEHSAAVGNDFSGAAGSFILATPTDGSMNSNETSGIWFLDMSSGSPMASLTLPNLPAGWTYEGWVVISGRPVTTGRITAVNAADQDAPFSGPVPGPPFPGEDFLLNAPAGLTFPTNLSGGMGVISIEPVPDDNPAPFTLKPLVGAIPAGAAPGVRFQMSQNAGSFPQGSARIDQ